MNSLFNEEYLWENLQKEHDPVVLYGMGDGADKILTMCAQYNITVSGIFASDDFVRAHSFRGFEVERFSDIENRLGKMVVLVAFGTTNGEVINFIKETGLRHKVYIPDSPVAGDSFFNREFLERNRENFMNAYNMFEDEKSKKLFSELIKYKISGKIEFLASTVTRSEMFEEFFKFGENEIFVDAGAYKGDTIEEFIALCNGQYDKIFALEPDGKNYRKLLLNIEKFKNITAVEAAAWNEDELLFFRQKSNRGGSVGDGEPNTRGVPIDSLVHGEKVSYIKYDVEGAELNAINGSRKTIINNQPKLLISAYHRPEDLFTLPIFIKKLQPNYRLYLRRNPGYPAWDINLICI